MRLSTTARVAPADGATYNPSSVYGTAGAGRITGTGNFVVYAGTPPVSASPTLNKITVTGLAAGTNYVVDVYAYNEDSSTDYLQTNPSTVAFLALPTYTWNNPNSTTPQDFGTASNWTPARTLSNTTGANANHVLIFNGITTASPAVQISRGFGGNQTQEQIFGQLYLVNNVNASFYAPSTANTAGTVQIGNATTAGDDFVEEAGSTLTMTTGSNTDNRYIVLTMPTGTTASLSGTVQNVLGTSLNIPQRFVAADAGAIRFKSGAVFSSTEVVGHPFGTTGTETQAGNNPNEASGKAGAGSVVFEAGATFVQNSGLDPFGNGASAVTTFQSGSTYRYFGGTFSEAARTYGNLDFRVTYATSGTFATTIQNNLTVTGTASTSPAVSLNNTGGVNIGGNISVDGTSEYGAALEFSPASAANVTLNGTSAVQTIGGISQLTFGTNATLVLNNPLGVRLLKAIRVPKALTFGTQSGRLFTSMSALLVMPTTAVASGADDNSYVEGPVARLTAGPGVITSTATTGLFFPIGTYNGYGPATLNLTQAAGTASGAFIATAIADRAPAYSLPAGPNDLQRVSGVRYYTLSADVPFTAGQLSLGFRAIDQVDAPSTLRIAQGVAGTWTNIGGVVTPPQPDGTTFLSGTISSNPGLTSLGDFVLATTNLSNAPGNNPLPVVLTSFTGVRQGEGSLLRWTTAQEKNSARFEVQRASNGNAEFLTIGTLAAAGNSSSARHYTFVDRNLPAGTVYYRLREVDTDGTETLSEVVTLKNTKQLEVMVRPNPVHDQLRVDAGTEPLQWRVLNLPGQTLLQGKAPQGSAVLDFSSLPAGSYLVEIVSGQQRTVRKVQKAD
ncbi:T9SS type A sorting domain-containing protein [Hymenobacter coalescens]